jgi:YD repeat-containing protein
VLTLKARRRIATSDARPQNEAATTYEYNSRGFMTRQTDPDGRITEYKPNDLGNLEYTLVEGLPGEDLTKLDSSSPFGSLIDPLAHWLVNHREADVMDNTLAQTDPRGNTTTYHYDHWNRVESVTAPEVADPNWNPLGGQPIEYMARASTKLYDFNSNVIEEVDQNGNDTTHVYDPMNRVQTTTLHMVPDADHPSTTDIITRYEYNAVGLLALESDARNNSTRHDYDALLRETQTTRIGVQGVADADIADPSAGLLFRDLVTKFYYGPNSGSDAFTLGGFQPTRVVDPLGRATDTEYDGAYRPIRTLRRVDLAADVSPDAAPQSGDLETDTNYNADGKEL